MGCALAGQDGVESGHTRIMDRLANNKTYVAMAVMRGKVSCKYRCEEKEQNIHKTKATAVFSEYLQEGVHIASQLVTCKESTKNHAHAVC